MQVILGSEFLAIYSRFSGQILDPTAPEATRTYCLLNILAKSIIFLPGQERA